MTLAYTKCPNCDSDKIVLDSDGWHCEWCRWNSTLERHFKRGCKFCMRFDNYPDLTELIKSSKADLDAIKKHGYVMVGDEIFEVKE